MAGLLGSMTTGIKYSMVTDGSEDGSKFVQHDKNEGSNEVWVSLEAKGDFH